MYDLWHHIWVVIPSGFIDLHIRKFAQTFLYDPLRLGGPVAMDLGHVGDPTHPPAAAPMPQAVGAEARHPAGDSP